MVTTEAPSLGGGREEATIPADEILIIGSEGKRRHASALFAFDTLVFQQQEQGGEKSLKGSALVLYKLRFFNLMYYRSY